jgi:hypothetical protein
LRVLADATLFPVPALAACAEPAAGLPDFEALDFDGACAGGSLDPESEGDASDGLLLVPALAVDAVSALDPLVSAFVRALIALPVSLPAAA